MFIGIRYKRTPETFAKSLESYFSPESENYSDNSRKNKTLYENATSIGEKYSRDQSISVVKLSKVISQQVNIAFRARSTFYSQMYSHAKRLKFSLFLSLFLLASLSQDIYSFIYLSFSLVDTTLMKWKKYRSIHLYKKSLGPVDPGNGMTGRGYPMIYGITK